MNVDSNWTGPDYFSSSKGQIRKSKEVRGMCTVDFVSQVLNTEVLRSPFSSSLFAAPHTSASTLSSRLTFSRIRFASITGPLYFKFTSVTDEQNPQRRYELSSSPLTYCRQFKRGSGIADCRISDVE